MLSRDVIGLLLVAVVVGCGRSEPARAPVGTEIPASEERAEEESSAAAPFEEHLAALRLKVPEGFTVVVEKPFVVIGDSAPDAVGRQAAGTVRWAVRLLQKDFFDTAPDRILDVWLFADKASYRKHTRELFGDEPGTPYGYYSSEHGALLMNIATGGGTLVHEIVHPFIEADFPDCPAWFNEGLGSLFEQSAERDGHIVGLTNWRLAGLKEAIAAGTLPSVSQLMSTTTDEFYGGDNYAQARYLLYYLQERGLLVEYYRRFRRDHKDDPTGEATFKAMLGLDDKAMPAFEKRWRTYVMALTFP